MAILDEIDYIEITPALPENMALPYTVKKLLLRLLESVIDLIAM